MYKYIKILGNTEKKLIPIFDLVEDSYTNSRERDNTIIGKAKLGKDKTVSRIESVSICNTHAANDAYIDIYYSQYDFSLADINDYSDEAENADPKIYTELHPTNKYNVEITKYYLTKELLIEHGNTFILEEEDFIKFDTRIYSLCVKLKATDGSVDIIINKITN